MDTNKYADALKKHPFEMTNDQVTAKVNEIIAKHEAENNTKEVLKTMYSCIDLTSLNTTDSKEDIWKFTDQVNQLDGANPEIDNVAAICVFPNFAKTVREALTTDVKIACVSAGFPASQTFSEIKVAETALAVADGADEIDVVINVGQFLAGEYEEMCEELTELKEACRDAHLKVILETGALKDAKKIHDAAILSMYCDADFVKTSTGKVYEGATLEAAYSMCEAIKSYYKESGRKVGFKVSGGVSTVDDAVKYYTIVKEMLGTEWCNKELFRIGTSRLAGKLRDAIEAQS